MDIICQEVSYIYRHRTPYARNALNGVNLTIDSGEAVGLIGPTGAGKSTLIQHFNGLLHPTVGTVTVDSVSTAAKQADLRHLRAKVGLVFQYPEHQLFEETVYADVAFGLLQLGCPPGQVGAKVEQALALVGLDGEYASRSPFSLSGGEKRKVALAGILALDPQVLVLDEPTAGLDPAARQELLQLLQLLHRRQHKTLIIVSHNMEFIAEACTRVVVLSQGRVAMAGTVAEVFSQERLLAETGLASPWPWRICQSLRARGVAIEASFTMQQLEEEVSRRWRNAHA